MREMFVERKFRRSSMKLIVQANKIIDDYQARGFTLTLRQLYYQFVARGLLDNQQHEYKRLGSVVNDARIAGLIDWATIEDRTRFMREHASWGSTQDFAKSALVCYSADLWEGQPYRPEVWIEKDALTGVIEPVCNEFRVPYFACRGYSSQSMQYEAGKRFENQLAAGLTPIIFHLGDHDPSGIDMTRDNADRLSMFAREGVQVERLALNWEQVEEHKPPPNPAKESDSRSTAYIARFGESSWELDALDPSVLDELLRTKITALIELDTWDAAQKTEKKKRALLEDAADRWGTVEKFLARPKRKNPKKRSQGRKQV